MKVKTMTGAEVDIAPEEIKRHAMAMGMKHEGHAPMMKHEDEYLNRAKDNIGKAIRHEHKIENEEDAKAILAHCLNLSWKQAEILYETMEFAIGMAD